MSLTVKCYPMGPLSENTYIVTDDATGLKAVVDPGYFGPDTKSDIDDPQTLRYILLTHGHYDHFAAARSYLDNYPDAVLIAPAGEERLLFRGRDNVMMTAGRADSACPEPGLSVREGDVIDLGETAFRVLETPGHTEGGVCYVTDSEAFTGDTLFRLSVGNTSFETGDWDTLVNSIQDKLYTLDDDIKVYPGHGGPTTIGFEKRANPFV